MKGGKGVTCIDRTKEKKKCQKLKCGATLMGGLKQEGTN